MHHINLYTVYRVLTTAQVVTVGNSRESRRVMVAINHKLYKQQSWWYNLHQVETTKSGLKKCQDILMGHTLVFLNMEHPQNHPSDWCLWKPNRSWGIPFTFLFKHPAGRSIIGVWKPPFFVQFGVSYPHKYHFDGGSPLNDQRQTKGYPHEVLHAAGFILQRVETWRSSGSEAVNKKKGMKGDTQGTIGI